MKQAIKTLIRRAAYNAPGGLRSSAMDGFLDRMRLGHVYSQVLPRCGIAEVAVNGDRGIVASAAADTMVIVEYAKTGTFAPVVTQTVQQFFAPVGGTYIDIGANIGLMTIPFARDSRIRCLAFEPEPLNFGFLQRNLARNAPESSAELHQMALFHEHSTLSLALADGNIGDHRVTLSGVPGRQIVQVKAVPLDDFVERIQGPLAIKIDTQGAEPFIIAGGHAVFAQAGLLVMEFCPYLMRQLGADPEVAITLIGGFPSVAVMRGGKAETPHYVSGGEAAQTLREKLRTARDTDEDYLDLIARR